MSLMDAPPPRTTLALPRLKRACAEDIVIALEGAGCVVVEDALDRQALAAVNDQLGPWFDQAQCGEGLFFGRRTKRFGGIFAKAPATAALALHPAILSATEALLCGSPSAPHASCIQLSQTQAIEIAPGEPAQLLHRDDDVFPFPKPFELIINVMWALDRFTSANGATRLAPGSHRWERQLNEQSEDGIESAAAPAGSAIIWLGSLVHGGGANTSDAPRRGLVMSYSLAWLAQAEKLLLSTPPEAARVLPERLQQLIGYQIHRPNLGWVEGCDPRDWLNGAVGPLASARDNLTPLQADLMQQYFTAVGR